LKLKAGKSFLISLLAAGISNYITMSKPILLIIGILLTRDGDGGKGKE
jgi:hypothetical protein